MSKAPANKIPPKWSKKGLDEQLDKAKKAAAVNLNPPMNREKKYSKRDEPPPMDIREIATVPDRVRRNLSELVGEHAKLSVSINRLTKDRKELTAEIKPLCEHYGLDRFVADGVLGTYFTTTRKSISRELLLAHGVPPEIIVACTEVSESDIFRSKSLTGSDEDDEKSD